jgi:large subunit ribosomal protein L13
MTTTTRNRTFSPRPRDVERRWYVVDADGAVLGRLASEVAKILRGKHKPIFAPHADTGDHVIVINARGVRLTGGKEGEKVYYRHSGYPGGLREIGYTQLLAERPVVAVEKAIKGMLPKNRLGRQMLTKLKVYEGAEHPHSAQQPASLKLGEIPRWDGLPAPKPQPEKPAKTEKPVKTEKTARARKSAPASRKAPSGKGGRPARTAASRASASRTAGTRSGRSSKADAGETGVARRPRKKKES